MISNPSISLVSVYGYETSVRFAKAQQLYFRRKPRSLIVEHMILRWFSKSSFDSFLPFVFISGA